MSPVTEIRFDEPIAAQAQESNEIAPVSLDEMFCNYGDMLTIDDLAEILHVSRKTAQSRCRRGDLPAISIGRRWYVPKAWLAEQIKTALSSHAVNQRPE